MNTQLSVIPEGLTSQVQPLDLSLNKPFKAFMHEEWTKWMEAPNHDLTPTRQTRIKYTTSLRMGEEFTGVCETQNNCEVFQEVWN
jgi:hypothetical protein